MTLTGRASYANKVTLIDLLMDGFEKNESINNIVGPLCVCKECGSRYRSHTNQSHTHCKRCQPDEGWIGAGTNRSPEGASEGPGSGQTGGVRRQGYDSARTRQHPTIEVAQAVIAPRRPLNRTEVDSSDVGRSILTADVNLTTAASRCLADPSACRRTCRRD
jgi:hypothetical protein